MFCHIYSMKKIIIYTLLATIFSSCMTEKKITEKKQIKEWHINYTENNLDSELPVSKSKNEILNDSYYQSKKILPVVEQLLAVSYTHLTLPTTPYV